MTEVKNKKLAMQNFAKRSILSKVLTNYKLIFIHIN